MAKKNINAEAMKNIILDCPFEPDMTDRQQELSQSQKLHNEAGDAVVKTVEWAEEMDISIPVGYAEKPKNGIHRAEVVDYEIKRTGVELTLRDVAFHNEWTTFIKQEKVKDAVQSTVYYNKEIHKALLKLESINPNSFYSMLKSKVIKVWTQELDTDKFVLTYFNEQKYQNLCMAIAYKRTTEK